VQARIVENMEASLTVPTATSVRTVPAKLLEVNRQILNNHLGRTGRGKVSFTHLIATRYARNDLNLCSSYEVDGTRPWFAIPGEPGAGRRRRRRTLAQHKIANIGARRTSTAAFWARTDRDAKVAARR
jgi:hypothetical protein